LRSLSRWGLLVLGCAAFATGSSRARAEDENEDAPKPVNDVPVVLPPFVVQALRIDKTPWRYATVPGFEILTRASDDDTIWIVDGLRRGQWLEEQLLPSDWLMRPSVPYIVVIDDTEVETAQSSDIHSAEIKFNSPADALSWGRYSHGIKVASERFGAGDQDTVAISQNVHDVDTNLPYLATISLDRLTRSTPPLPRWVTAGLLGPHFGLWRESFAPAGVDDPAIVAARIIRNYGAFRSAVGPGTLWVSLEETQRLLKQIQMDKKMERETEMTMLPLGRLFSEAAPAREDLPLWESEAALFMRWGLMGPGHANPALSHAFLDFVRRARHEPVTELVFRDCFGFGYETMEGKLKLFLRDVLAQPNQLAVDFPTDFPVPRLKAATSDQIGRLLGDWLRMQGDSLRKSDPDLSAKFFYAAGRTLRRAYQYDNGLPPEVDPSPSDMRPAKPSRDHPGEPPVVLKPFVVTAARIHDAGLLTMYGLYEHDTGDDVKAREFLEKAVKTGTVRPRARVVLAQLYYAQAMAQPLGANGKLSPQQAAAILAPLSTFPQTSSYFDADALIVATWLHCEAKAPASEIAKIMEGVAQFPRNTQLIFLSALVCSQSGDLVQASGLIDRSLIFVTDAEERSKFERLRAALAH
jgi:hypothetical protein